MITSILQNGLTAPLVSIPGVILRNAAPVEIEDSLRRCSISKEEFLSLAKYSGAEIPYRLYWRLAESVLSPTSEFVHTVRLYTTSFCPHRCTFCTAQRFGWQFYTAPHSLDPEEIAQLICSITSESSAVYFNDDDFLLSPTRASNLFSALIRAKQAGTVPGNLMLIGQTRVSCVNPEVLDLGVKAGLRVLSFGVESFSDASLMSPELKKGFTGKQAFDSVKASLSVGVPITNINLILFHPTVTVEALLETIERSVELLHVALETGSRLALNSFPFLELYAGSPLVDLAKEKGWPIVNETIQGPANINVEIRNSVATDLVPCFESILEGFTHDPRWPLGIVDRSIGVNGLALFIACLKLLNINHPTLTTTSLTDLVFSLIERFHSPSTMMNPLPELNSSLSCDFSNAIDSLYGAKTGNVIFTFDRGKWKFTCGNLTLPVPPNVCHWIGRTMHPLQDVMLPHCGTVGKEALTTFLKSCLDGTCGSFEDVANKVPSVPVRHRNQFIRILLIAPCGTAQGGASTLPFVAPHWGLEQLRHYMTHDTDFVDCRVFNPNLCDHPAESLKIVLSRADYDVVGFSFIPQTLRNDAPLIMEVYKTLPDALLVCGGLNISHYPHAKLFESLPFDIYVAGPGEAILHQIASFLLQHRTEVEPWARFQSWKFTLFRKLSSLPNLFIRVLDDSCKYIATASSAFQFMTVNADEIGAGIAYTTSSQDVVNTTCYKEVDNSRRQQTVSPYPCGTGVHKLYVKVSDKCRGRCVFCSAPRDQTVPTPVASIISAIQNAMGPSNSTFDCVHVSDNDFLVDVEVATEICDEIIKAGLTKIPKTCKARADTVSPTVLSRLNKAGFVQITLGIESFCDSVLNGMCKDTTEKTNLVALDCCLSIGINPAMDLLFFSPWETKETLAYSCWRAATYSCLGACVHVTPQMYTQFGDKFSMLQSEQVDLEDISVIEGKPNLKCPINVRLCDPMRELHECVCSRWKANEMAFKAHHTGTHSGFVSMPAKGLLFLSSVIQTLLQAEGVPVSDSCPCSPSMQSIPAICDHTICKGMFTCSTYKVRFRFIKSSCLQYMSEVVIPEALRALIKTESTGLNQFPILVECPVCASQQVSDLEVDQQPRCQTNFTSLPPKTSSSKVILSPSDFVALAEARKLCLCKQCNTCFNTFSLPGLYDALYQSETYFCNEFSSICGYCNYPEQQLSRIENGRLFMDLLNECLQKSGLPNPKTVTNAALLDLGSGFGANIMAAYKAGWKAYGIDCSMHAVEQSQGLLANLSGTPPVPLIFHTQFWDSPSAVLSTHNLEQPYIVTMFDVLEHVSTPREYLRNVRQILLPQPSTGKPPGVLLLRVPVYRAALRDLPYKVDHLLYLPLDAVQQLLVSEKFSILHSQKDFFTPTHEHIFIAQPLL
ncbi:B12-binding radical SAM domain protein [Pelomyxa schiedti]|nr:B12-binding radical SAM domain protein [Pelomyxa schiedti]